MKNPKSNLSANQSAFFDSGLNEYTGDWGTPQVVHLLKRTLFGASINSINYFKAKTMSEAVDELLTETLAPSTFPLNNYNVDGYVDPTGVAAWQTWINASLILSDDELNAKRLNSLQLWWMGQLLNEQGSIHEKITLFWHNHFATNMYKDATIRARFWYDHYLTLRKNALGDFKKMVKEITVDPAMLYFLNGNLNKKESPNENYGRELQELYTQGKGIDSKYTEDDVRAATRVLTGHTVREDNFTYFFDAGEHDADNKEFSSYYANQVVTGKTGEPGATEVDEMLGIFFNTDECAKFICRKIYRFFIYYVIDDAIEENVIKPLADIFRSSNYNIKSVLSALFKSEHFYDLVYSSACIIKSPIDFIVGLCREFDVKIPGASDAESQYDAWSVFFQQTAVLQQEIGGIPEVAGWYAYYLAPTYHELWINSVTYTQRNIFTDMMIADGITMNTAKVAIDPLSFAAQLPNPEDPNDLISDSLTVLFRYPVSEASKNFMKKSVLLSGQTNDYYWTTAWQNYINNPTDDMARNIVSSRLKSLYKYLMNLAEYHLS